MLIILKTKNIKGSGFAPFRIYFQAPGSYIMMAAGFLWLTNQNKVLALKRQEQKDPDFSARGQTNRKATIM